jgi:hypothetical protein
MSVQLGGRRGGRLSAMWRDAAPAERYSAKAVLDWARGTRTAPTEPCNVLPAPDVPGVPTAGEPPATRGRRGRLFCDDQKVQTQRYTAAVIATPRGGAFVPVPFDPDQVWHPKPRHHITGTVNGVGIRGVIETYDGQLGFTLGPAWLRDRHADFLGDAVTVEIRPEGPQRDELAADVAAALDANPSAAAFFDSLAQFYRNAYLRWIDGTKRRPDLRTQRIEEMVQLLESGIKQRPKV